MLGTKILFACTEKIRKKKSQRLKIRVYKIHGSLSLAPAKTDTNQSKKQDSGGLKTP